MHHRFVRVAKLATVTRVRARPYTDWQGFVRVCKGRAFLMRCRKGGWGRA